MCELLDLLHLGRPEVVGVYLLEAPEPALVDCGPSTCMDTLERELAWRGLRVGDLRHLYLTHVHFDHAGCAGSLVRANPRLLVHVSEIGAPHMIDPSRLESSARRVTGAEFDRVWGAVVPVPADNVRPLEDRVNGLRVLPTPGHAKHHVAFVSADGDCFAGDSAGVRISPAELVVPPAPPPDVDVEAWLSSLDRIAAATPARLCLAHFGVFEDVEAHLERMRARLLEWVELVRGGVSEDAFAEARAEELEREVAPPLVAAYAQAAPSRHTFAGLRRYVERAAAR